jgi:GNAT superfamily N-acetyltransferase
MNLIIERAAEADAETLVNAEISAFHNDTTLYGVPLGGPPGYDSVDSALQKIREDDYYKIVYDGQIVGGIVVYDEGGGHFHLDLIFIHPDYHNLGIGTRAMQFIEQAYPTATRWTLNTPTYAIRNQHFYEKHGFVNVGEEVYPDITLIIYAQRIS